MRTLCDVCEGAPAILFCAADEAALCRPCDDKVHMCNKLASRHIRVGLADPSAVPRCDICENAPAFFYCEIDGSSLCLQCDMSVHVGGKRTHERYLLLRQRVQFLGDKPGLFEDLTLKPTDPVQLRRDKNQLPQQNTREKLPNHTNTDDPDKLDTTMIDLNARPHRIHDGQASNGPISRGSSNEFPSGAMAVKRNV